MAEMADFIVVADSVWNSQEGKMYFKGQTIRLSALTKTNDDSSVQPIKAESEDDAPKRRGRPAKSE